MAASCSGPLYLHALGKHGFGVLIIVFGFVNTAGAGAAWLTGGMLRILGEYPSQLGRARVCPGVLSLRLGYLLYAAVLGVLLLIVVELAGGLWFRDATSQEHVELVRGLRLCALYLVVLYDLSVERLR